MKTLVAIFFSIVSMFIGSTEKNISGIILPHHDLAKEIFHTSIEKLSKSRIPSTIVIYGTNHYYPAGPTFTTTKDILEKYDIDDLYANDERISREHSIQTVIPYLKQYFPDAKIIPIIISSSYDLKKLSVLSKFLVKSLPEDTLYVASVDFSHNSTVESGLTKNKESIDAISNFNYQKVLSYDDTHMDSPVAISTFMLTMENLNAKKWETWSSSHGGLITNTPNLNGTSYVVGVFR